MQVRELMQQAPVIPVLVVDDVKYAVPLAEALVAGGLPVLEVTMRTTAALNVVRAMTSVTGAIVGVGTALDGDDLRRAKDHGASFAVSPGYTQALGTAARQLNLPLLPGVMTPAEIMRARDAGYTELKFFPAEQAGGTRLLKAFAGPFAEIVFCPTGGITASNAKEFLVLDNVLCVGGSWVAPKIAMQENNWASITHRARECSQL